ncbi:spermidine/putrescine-binding protein [Agrobacterium sp. RC10-4-1]|nr:spermidine/putrescine-binding protein [Agrobacterium sp. RC10-4-1]
MKWKILFVTLSVTVTIADKASSEQLIVNSYGGPYEEIIRSRIIEPFEKEFNVKVIYDAVGSASQDSDYPPETHHQHESIKADRFKYVVGRRVRLVRFSVS